MPRIVLILVAFLFLLLPKSVAAIVDPLKSENNIYGIHILDPKDLTDAAKLVNSQGGDWGYITLVIRSDERDTTRWQKVFDTMRKLHLIPIVRLASKSVDGNWEKLKVDEVDGWVSFLNGLNWVVENRYVVIGNEPNHATEWGGSLNPEEYADYLEKLATNLKNTSSDFFVMPAGFDASAPTDSTHMTEEEFLTRMLKHKPSLFDQIDGWSSHSYPNPNFSGSELDTGRGSVKTYDWELSLLRNLGVNKSLPVFITETGWAHNKDNKVLGKTNGFAAPDTTALKLKNTYQNVWAKDSRVVAVTPFLLNYTGQPFDVFSWKKEDGTYYEVYNEIQNVSKAKGKPSQKTEIDVLTVITPEIIIKDAKNYALAYVRNRGQTILYGGNSLLIDHNNRRVEMETLFPTTIEPFRRGLIIIRQEEANLDMSMLNWVKFGKITWF